MFIDTQGNQIQNYSVILINEQESIKLECLVDSYPSAFLSWIFNEQVIATNQTVIQINNIGPLYM